LTSCALTVALVLALTSAAGFAADGTALPRPGSPLLANKDVGAERWSIGLSLTPLTSLGFLTEEPEIPPAEEIVVRAITGNVFLQDGRPPSFIYCDRVGSPHDLADESARLRFECWGTSSCTRADVAE
jgi:hypothetical protein